MACILETACYLIHGNEGGKQFAVLSLHILYKDGMSFIQRFELHGGKRYPAERLLIEGLVFREDKFDASSFCTVLQIGIKLFTLIGFHSLYEYLFSVFQFLNFVRSQGYPFDFIRDIDMLLSDGYQFVGILVDGNQTRLCRVATQVKVSHASHVPALTQVLLVLFREDMSEIRTVQFRFFSDTVDAQHDLPAVGYERKACIELCSQYPRNVECQRHCPVGLVSFQHAVKLSGLLQHFLGYAELTQLLPVNHVLVVAVRGCLLALRFLLFAPLCGSFHL